MSCQLPVWIYWIVIITWVSCSAEPTGNSTTKTDGIKTTSAATKILNTTTLAPQTTSSPNVTTTVAATTTTSKAPVIKRWVKAHQFATFSGKRDFDWSGHEFRLLFTFKSSVSKNFLFINVVDPDPELTKDGLTIRSTINGSSADLTLPISINDSYSIELSQEQIGDSSNFNFIIKVNNVVKYTIMNSQPTGISPWVFKEKSVNGTATYSNFTLYKKDFPPTTVPPTLPTTKAPSMQLEKLILTQTNVMARSFKVQWSPNRPQNMTQRFNLTIAFVLKGDGKVIQKNISSLSGLGGETPVSNLKPFTEYTVTTAEVVGSRRGPKSVMTVKTSQAAPSKPQNLQVVQHTTNSVKIKWDPPAELNGDVVQMEVAQTYQETLGQERKVFTLNSTSSREYLLEDLYSYVSYKFSVREKTVDYGDYSHAVGVTMKAAPIALIKSDSIRFVNQSQSFVDISLIQARLVWKGLTKREWGDDYVEYKISGLPLKNYYTNKTYVDVRLKPYKNFTIEISAGNSKGYNKAITKTLITRETAPSKPRGVVLFPFVRMRYRYHYINVSWNAPEFPNGKSTRFSYTVQMGCSSVRCKRAFSGSPSTYEKDLINGKRHFIIGQSGGIMLEPFTEYSVQIKEKTGCLSCWGELSDVQRIKTLPGPPSAVENVEKYDLESSSVSFSWEPPQYPNGIVKEYQIELSRYPDKIPRKVPSIAGKQKYSIKYEDLEDDKEYTCKITAINEAHGGTELRGETKTVWFKTPQSRTWLFILIGCLVVVLIVVLILSIYLLISRRRRTYKGVPTLDVELSTKTKAKPILMANFKAVCAQQHCNSDHGFQQEYEQLRSPVRQFTWEYSSLPCNQVKNRYSNIVAYDHSRVVLETIEDDPSSSYINGNYIDGYIRDKQYIATQGPLPETIIDFWRMIWDEKCPIIVMLTKLVEDNKLKCERYWPEFKAMQYRDIVVTITSVEEMTDMTVKTFKLHKINNPELGVREVRHFHYTAWPDHGVPVHPTSMVSFIKHVMSYFPKELDNPIVVHCSAGVGRTGTFIAIEGLLRQMETQDTVDIFGTVLRMRMQRNFMVQTESQYTFIYDALLDNVVCGNTEISPENLVSKIKYLNEQDSETGETRFMSEFKRLESGFRIKDKEQFTDASHPENKTKNRFLNILPFDKNRIRLSPVAGARLSDYINASIIDGFQQKHAFIATQAPLENTVVDFWRMVSEQNVHVIVMLTKIEEKGQEKCYLYWPQAGMVSYGAIHVEVLDVRNQNDVYIIHDLRITNRDSGKSWTVTHFLYLGWPEYHGSPDSGTDLIHFIGLVEKTQRSLTDSGPTLVHCSGGVGRTGVFITVFNSVERLKAKSVVDVFQTTRALRLQRSAMVQTIDQYKFCYQCLKDYMDSFDLYANPEC